MKRRSLIYLFLGVLLLMFFNSGCIGQKVKVGDIIKHPAKFEGEMVTVSGLAENPYSKPEGTIKGYFSVRDDDDNTITVKTKKLPAPGTTVTVSGTVWLDLNNTPWIKEENSQMLLYAGAAFIVLILLLIVLMLLMKKPEPPAQPRPGIYVKQSDSATVLSPLQIILLPESGIDHAESATIYGIPQNNAMSIGTKEDCFIQVIEPAGPKTVSSLHARLTLDPKSKELSVLALSNAFTKVNTDNLGNGESHVVKDGDRLTFGNVVVRVNLKTFG